MQHHSGNMVGRPGGDKSRSDMITLLVLSIALTAVTLAAYWPVTAGEFVHYDDNDYVTENRHIQPGLTWQGARWAFTTGCASNWHPLTWLSHMLDCELFGLNPRGHHTTNLLLHTANTLLLFIVFRSMSGAIWQSAFVAVFFALHPLHVESVAWVAERKDVLSTLFWLLTMAAYLGYVRRPCLSRYLLVLPTFALGLMAKPMLVTLPFVLLLLDYWPLGRFPDSRAVKAGGAFQWPVFYRLVREKLGLFLLAAVSSVVTFIVQRAGGAVAKTETFPLSIRIANALVSYVKYIGKMFWPSRLGVFYPHPGDKLPMWQVVSAAIFLVAVTIVVLRLAGRHKYLPVGWFWYIGTLVPVIGLVQVGGQALADRYTYIPLIGLFLIVSFFAPEFLQTARYHKLVLSISAAGLICAMTICTHLQAGRWRDSISLFEHTLAVTNNNFIIHNNYANVLKQKGRFDEAVDHLYKSLEIKPDSAEAHTNLGNALCKLGKIEQAVEHYEKALKLKPDLAAGHYNLAIALTKLGKVEEAVEQYRQALRIEPDELDCINNLGFLLAEQGRFDQAVECYKKAVRLKPDFTIARGRLGLALAETGRVDEAIEHFRIVLADRADDVEMYCNLGILLQKTGRIKEAVTQYRNALRIDPQYARARKLLNAASAAATPDSK